MPSVAQLAVALPASVIVIDILRRFLLQGGRQGKGLPLPPGPTPIPLLGNTLQINLEQPWRTYTEWHALYGDVLYLRLLDQDVIVLGSQPIAVELLEKRSQLYSDRPFLATLLPYGGECNFVFAAYGDHWRFCRRIFHQTFRADSSLTFRPMQLRMARQLVLNMVDDPQQYPFHYTTFSTAVALSAVYDYEPQAKNDPIVHIIDAWAAAAIPASTPERAILWKLFPFLKDIPDWFPGAALKLEARRAHAIADKMVDMPYQYVVDLMTSKERPTNSMVSDHICRMQQYDESYQAEYVRTLKVAAASSIQNAGETTMSSLMVFTLAMVTHPHVWKRAQAEIDSVVGTHRLPDYEDRASLPYVEAVLRETVRWHPVTPLAVWHATTSDDVYNGQYIPKGATVVANVWAMSRNEARFPNAEEFKPERFLTGEGALNDNNPMDFIFGFGRRVCPGRYTADASLWTSIVTMLATLNFGLAKDAQGNDIEFEPKYFDGITHRPDTFPCNISPRSHIEKSFLECARAM